MSKRYILISIVGLFIVLGITVWMWFMFKSDTLFLNLFGLTLKETIYTNHAELSKNKQDIPFSLDIENLEIAKPSETIELKDGDTYDMVAQIVKKNLVGSEVKMLAYNGMIPGPLLKVSQNATITLRFTNMLDVETTLHSHGIRLDNKYDGVPDLTQKVIMPGESFTYKIKFPDAGIYWYHPHVREDYAQEMGLYGNYLVESSDKNYWSPVNNEMSLMVDDVLIEQQGIIAPFSQKIATHTLMGRFGNVMLLNGEANFELQTKLGEVWRFYVTNAANTRTFNLQIPGVKIKRVAADGGKYEKEEFVDSLILGSSERVVIEALFDRSGEYEIMHKTPDKTYMLGKITVANEASKASYLKEFNTLRTNTEVISDIDKFRPYFDKASDKNLSLTLTLKGSMMGGMQGSSGSGGSMMMNHGEGGMMMAEGTNSGPIEWEDSMAMMNTMSTSENVKWEMKDTATGKTNMDINWKFKKGDVVKIKIFNDPKSAHPMQHPVHFHGQRFLVLSINGNKNTNLVWKDTFLLGKGETAEILLDASNPGLWMAHCHIAEHLESGMMMQFKVE